MRCSRCRRPRPTGRRPDAARPLRSRPRPGPGQGQSPPQARAQASGAPGSVQPGAGPAPGTGPCSRSRCPVRQVPGPGRRLRSRQGGALVEDGRHDAVPHDQVRDHTPPQPHPTSAPTGRRRRAVPDGSAEAGRGGRRPGAHRGRQARRAVVRRAAGASRAGSAWAGRSGAGCAGPGQPACPRRRAAQPGTVAPGGTAGRQLSPVSRRPHPAAGHRPRPAPARRGTPRSAAPAPGSPGSRARPAPRSREPRPAPQPWPAADDTTGVPPNPATPRTRSPTEPADRTSPTAPPGHPRPRHSLRRGRRAAAPGRPAAARRDHVDARIRIRGRAHAAAAAAPAPVDPNSTQGRAISVRTLGQGVPFTRQAAQVQQPRGRPTATLRPTSRAVPAGVASSVRGPTPRRRARSSRPVRTRRPSSPP